jgi:protein SCO1/2
LTGDEANIRRLADAVGFHYLWDEQTQQYAHASGIMIATPEGKLARYFYGVEYAPRDLRLGLIEASQNKIGTPVDT